MVLGICSQIVFRLFLTNHFQNQTDDRVAWFFYGFRVFWPNINSEYIR